MRRTLVLLDIKLPAGVPALGAPLAGWRSSAKKPASLGGSSKDGG